MVHVHLGSDARCCRVVLVASPDNENGPVILRERAQGVRSDDRGHHTPIDDALKTPLRPLRGRMVEDECKVNPSFRRHWLRSKGPDHLIVGHRVEPAEKVSRRLREAIQDVGRHCVWRSLDYDNALFGLLVMDAH